MTPKRRTMRQLSDERNEQRRAEMEVAVAEGRLTVRQMTPAEWAKSKRERADAAARRTGRNGPVART